MGREYSNRRPSRARSSAPNQFLVIVVTFLLGYLTATIFDIETITRWLNSQVLAHQEQTKASGQQQAEKKATIPPKPKFEFYTLLTNEKTPNTQPAPSHPAAATTAAQTAAAPAVQAAKANNMPKAQQPVAVKTAEAKFVAPPPPAGKGTFSVQVASFKARQDAEHMKGLLILKGFNVAVVPISHASRGNWFRVVVGPFGNRTLAQKAQVDLAKNERLRGVLVAG